MSSWYVTTDERGGIAINEGEREPCTEDGADTKHAQLNKFKEKVS